MRPLTIGQAGRCESAKTNRCRCRCGGALHGARRGEGEEFLRALPETDPHRVPDEETRREIIRQCLEWRREQRMTQGRLPL